MNRTKKATRINLGAAILLTATYTASLSASAATLTYAMSGEIQDGPLVGLPAYSGNFSFDDGSLTGVGDESVTVNALSFDFANHQFDVSDGSATVWFSDGVLQGLNFSVTNFDPAFSIVPGLIDTSDAYLAYELAAGGAGFGSISYALVPAPAALWLLVSGLGAIVASSTRRRPRTAVTE